MRQIRLCRFVLNLAAGDVTVLGQRRVRGLPASAGARVRPRHGAAAGGQAISADTFVPDARGRSQLVADVPTLTTRPDALAVTVEPEGGVPAPTGPKYLLGVPGN